MTSPHEDKNDLRNTHEKGKIQVLCYMALKCKQNAIDLYPNRRKVKHKRVGKASQGLCFL